MKGTGLYQSFWAVIVIALFIGHHVYASTCDSIPLKMMEQTWYEFRDIHPFGFQTVGLKHYGDSCVFIMSEPAEWVRSEDLEKLFTENGGHLIVGRKSFGYDGGLYDAIGCVKLDSVTFQTFEKNLFKLLYRTAYKPFYTDLDHPSPHVYYSKKNLNFEISHLNWLNDSWWQEKFENSHHQISSFWNLVNNKKNSNELYYSKKRGFVVWKINPNKLDNRFCENARRFALDTDFVLSAFCKADVFLVGRAREVPLTTLPPLRSETIQLLASLDSIEFKAPLAIPYSIEDSVWAKGIMMPKKMKNTELGNLLTTANLILMYMDNQAMVKDYFIDYPRPSNQIFNDDVEYEFLTKEGVMNGWYLPNIYPDIPQVLPLFLQSNNQSSGLHHYSINTSDRFSLILLNRTGCLMPWLKQYHESTDTVLNEKIHEYISSLNNTDLVRMAQYAIIYQAFRYFKSKKGCNTLSQHSDSVPKEQWVQTPSTMVLNTNCNHSFTIKVEKPKTNQTIKK